MSLAKPLARAFHGLDTPLARALRASIALEVWHKALDTQHHAPHNELLHNGSASPIMPTSPETAHFLAQPYAFLERAAGDGIATLVFDTTEDAKYFHRQLRALNWGRAKPLGCVVRRYDNVVTAATDLSLVPGARYVEP